MSSKAFRGIHNVKNKSSSSSFISLHFNKADEDQIEISYSDDKKCKDDSNSDESDISKSNSASTNQSVESISRSSYDSVSSNKNDATNDSLFRSYLSRKKTSSLSFSEVLEDASKNILKLSEEKKFDEPSEVPTGGNMKPSKSTEFTNSFYNDKTDLSETVSKPVVDVSDNSLKLSPAIEAAEIEDKNIFNDYINDELSKAKCEILVPKKQISPQSKHSFYNETLISSKDDHKIPENLPAEMENKLPQVTEGSTLLSAIKRCSEFVIIAKNSVKFHILIAILACFFAPIPSWFSGFFIGLILSGCCFYWLLPQKSTKSFLNYNYIERENVQVSEVKNDSGIFKGWMNELPSFLSYNPEKYHVSCTRSLYVRLDGSYLRFSYPAKNIPKRAMFNEPRHELQFIHQQHYDVTGAIVELVPKGLASKRLWSKKYPICLRIQNSKDAVLSNPLKSEAADSSSSSKAGQKKENPTKRFTPRINDCNEVVIYLFSRTDRDKQLWYHRFLKASMMKVSPVNLSNDSTLENKRAMSLDFATLQFSSSDPDKQSKFFDGNEETDGFVDINMTKQQKFDLYMLSLLAPLHSETPYFLSTFKKEKKDSGDKKVLKATTHQSGNLMWLNALMGRVFFDFFVEDVWALLVKEKIQKKLNKLKLPFFLNELTVKDIHLGSALPKIHHASDPVEDERGLWIDVDLSYNGSFHMTLETKLKLKGGNAEELWSPVGEQVETTDYPMKSPVYNSDEEDSAESSSDEDVPVPAVNTVDSPEDSIVAGGGGSTSRKILKLVDRLAQSQYFQSATRNKYIKRAMEDLSNMPLLLTVEVQWLTGTLALNIPPWPSNRLWYGFRHNPSLSLIARPMLGQKAVTLTHVTEWIEKKLLSEFQKVLVMPNMDDLIIPIMQHSDLESF